MARSLSALLASLFIVTLGLGFTAAAQDPVPKDDPVVKTDVPKDVEDIDKKIEELKKLRDEAAKKAQDPAPKAEPKADEKAKAKTKKAAVVKKVEPTVKLKPGEIPAHIILIPGTPVHGREIRETNGHARRIAPNLLVMQDIGTETPVHMLTSGAAKAEYWEFTFDGIPIEAAYVPAGKQARFTSEMINADRDAFEPELAWRLGGAKNGAYNLVLPAPGQPGWNWLQIISNDQTFANTTRFNPEQVKRLSEIVKEIAAAADYPVGDWYAPNPAANPAAGPANSMPGRPAVKKGN